MCGDLNTALYLTLPASERISSFTDIDISNLNHLKENVKATDKTLCVITNESSQQYIDIVKDLLNIKVLHDKLFILCLNTHAGGINLPDGAYHRMFIQDSRTINASARQLLSKATGTVVVLLALMNKLNLASFLNINFEPVCDLIKTN